MAVIQEAIQKLEYINKLIVNPNFFSKDEIKDQLNDTPLIKVLKSNIQLPEVIKQKEQERDARPNITLAEWNNDYSKRPTQTDFNKEVQDRVKTENNLTQEQNKTKQLEKDKTQLTTDLTNKNNEIKTILNKWKASNLTELSEGIQAIVNELDASDEKLTEVDNHIKVLKAKNEKLTENNKKLYGYLGEAWKMVSHLQKDLQTEKQDKVHIQQELNDALTILNKPTTEMGTQTDLTAEQISQMEKDLEYQRNLLYQGSLEIEKLEQELKENKEVMDLDDRIINSLEAKIEKLTPNEVEKHLLTYINWKNWKPTDYEQIKKELESNTLLPKTQLREEYLAIKDKLLELANSLLKKKELGEQMEQKNKELVAKNKDLSDLQTKYDMEIKTKEHLSKLLNIYRNCGIIFSNGSIGFNGIGYLKEFFRERGYNKNPSIFYWNPNVKDDSPVLEMSMPCLAYGSILFVNDRVDNDYRPAFNGFKIKLPNNPNLVKVNFSESEMTSLLRNNGNKGYVYYLDNRLNDFEKGSFW